MKSRLALALSIALIILTGPTLASRAGADSFNPNNLIDDAIFDNAASMSTSQIDSFLNQFPNSCISTGHGFLAPDPIGYNPTQGFLYGGNVTAGQVLHDAAAAYGVSPEVLLTTLQKEQGLVSGNGYYGCGANAYAASVGYGCPDSGTAYNYSGLNMGTVNGVVISSVSNTCVNSAAKAGFSQQIIRAAWLLKFGEQRSEGNINWNVQLTNSPESGDSWDNSDDPQSCYSGPMTQGTWSRCPSGGSTYYDGYTTIDSTSTHMDNGATAALYWYTPHFAGNQNFDTIFSSWFGTLYTNDYYAAFFSQSAPGPLNPGQQGSAYIMYKNLGRQTWYDDTSIGTAPSGTYPMHLATDNPINRVSQFSSTWPGGARPAVNFAAVYESDGTTLAANQHVATPGEVVKFSFNLTVPSNQMAGNYNEYFTPVLEGTSGSFNDQGVYLTVTVNSVPALSWYDQSGYPTVAAGTQANVTLRMQNTGNTSLYDDTSLSSAPSGTYPVHLATTNPLNTPSDFSATWPGAARPAVNFAAVYESDGTTLAPNQHVAQPGQIIKFSFVVTPPNQYAANTYALHVQPILEGTGGYFPDSGIFWNITVPSAPAFSITNTTPGQTLSSGQPGQMILTIKNVGNNTADAGTNVNTVDGSAYKTSAWTSSSQITSLASSLAAGASTNISLPLLAPIASSYQSAQFNCSFVDNGQSVALAVGGCPISFNVAPYDYSAAYVGESNWPSLAPGQQATVYFEYKNIGNQYWYDDSSVGTSAWRNAKPVHLATANPVNRPSSFISGWPSANRPVSNFSAVYESDGTTLAANQHVVQPNQIVKFSFVVSPAMNLGPGTYREYFQPIVEGTGGLISWIGTFEDINVQPPTYIDSFYSQSGYPHLSAGGQATSFVMLKNSGNETWYDDTSIGTAPSGTYPMHLATDNPINRVSQFSSTWPGGARPAVNFAAVYESDGTTLAANQHVVQPGQIGKFSFAMTAPNNIANGTYKESFLPILEGTNGVFNNLGVYTDVVIQ